MLLQQAHRRSGDGLFACAQLNFIPKTVHKLMQCAHVQPQQPENQLLTSLAGKFGDMFAQSGQRQQVTAEMVSEVGALVP